MLGNILFLCGSTYRFKKIWTIFKDLIMSMQCLLEEEGKIDDNRAT